MDRYEHIMIFFCFFLLPLIALNWFSVASSLDDTPLQRAEKFQFLHLFFICFRLHDFGFNPGSTPTLLSYSHYDGLAFRELRWDGNGWEIGNREMEAAI
ncbi:hypothetical protein EYC84_007910 [Monilinia fructicola]|uniref:Uncharacterized protein n=1 Tax=Monilinia fructicola TaxID=38448 RepID=A0A5M9JHM4_MONFR|nr:hypothetical protein EYC84_007910 [Monilinia fructicola]